MFARTREWWESRMLDDPEWRRVGGGELSVAVLEDDGRPEAYAIYRLNFAYEGGVSKGTVVVLEAMGATPEAEAAIWRYLLDIDWMERIEAQLLPVDHPLLLLAAEPGRLRFRVGDGIFLRLVDVGAALAARSFEGDDSLVLEGRRHVLPLERRVLHGAWPEEHGGARSPPLGRRARLRIPRRLHLLAARAGRRGGGGFRGSAHPRGCALPHGPGALVPRDLLSFC